MIIWLVSYFILSAIITSVLAYFLSDKAGFKEYAQAICFGWLFVICIVLYTIILLVKIAVSKVINLFIE